VSWARRSHAVLNGTKGRAHTGTAEANRARAKGKSPDLQTMRPDGTSSLDGQETKGRHSGHIHIGGRDSGKTVKRPYLDRLKQEVNRRDSKLRAARKKVSFFCPSEPVQPIAVTFE